MVMLTFVDLVGISNKEYKENFTIVWSKMSSIVMVGINGRERIVAGPH